MSPLLLTLPFVLSADVTPAFPLSCPAGTTKILQCAAPEFVPETDDPRAIAFLDAAIACKVGDVSPFDSALVIYRDPQTQRVSESLPAQQVLSVGSIWGNVPPGAAMTFDVQPPNGPQFYLSYSLFDVAPGSSLYSSISVRFDTYATRMLACEQFETDPEPAPEPTP